MPINYDNVFAIVGKAIKSANYYESLFATMKSNSQALSQTIVDQNLDHLADGISGATSGHISGLSSGCQYWVSKVTETLLDPTLVTNHLAITTPSLQTVLAALYAAMADDNEYLLESNTEVGTPTFNGVGNGSLLTTLYLDDVSNIVSNPSATNMNYVSKGNFSGIRTSELGIVDTVYARCTNGDIEGQETFLLFGNSTVGPYNEFSESLGGSISVQTTLANNVLDNPGFETYSSPNFTNWTITSSPGGSITQETSLMYREASALRINTLANADSVLIQQTLSTPLTRGKGYIWGFRLKSVAAEAANTIVVSGSLWDGSTELPTTVSSPSAINISTTNWQNAKGYLYVPQTIDPDSLLTIKVSLSPTADGVDGIIIDDFFLVPADYFNGVGFCLQNGSTRFRTGDIFEVGVSRSSPGIIQEFFRKNYGVQMPSEQSGAETIPDSLAT